MSGSYILHNDLHYNGLMTYWGLGYQHVMKRKQTNVNAE